MQSQDHERRRDLRGLGGALLRQALLIQFGSAAVVLAVLLSLRGSAGGGGADPQAILRAWEGLQTGANALLERLAIPLTALFSLLGGLIVVRFALRRGVSLRAGLRTLGPYTWKHVPMLCVALLGVNLLSSLAVSATEWLFNRFGYTILLDSIYQGDAVSWWLTFAYAVVLGPIIEETVYRGALMGILGRCSERFAVIASSVVFALMHGNLHQFLPTLLIGLALGYLFAKTGSLKLVIVLHAANNLLATIIAEGIYPRLGDAALYLDGLLVFGVGALGTALFARQARALGPMRSESAIDHPYRVFFGGGAMIVYGVIYVLIIVGMVGRL